MDATDDGMMAKAAFFNKQMFSDITLKLSNGREIPCHRVILFRSCNYFLTMLRPESNFKETSMSTIELKDDKPEAAESMLRYIYTGGYVSENERYNPNDWERHLDISITANKYGVYRLENKAFLHFEKIVQNSTNILDIIDILRRLYEIPGLIRFQRFARELRQKHLKGLLKEDRFRELLESNKDLMWEFVKELALTDDPAKS